MCRKGKIFLFLVVVIFLYSCKRTEVDCDCVAPNTPTGRWYFIGYVKADNISTTETKAKYPFNAYIEFDQNERKMEGKMAVNLITANYKFENRTDDFRGNDLTFQQLGSTKIAVTDSQGIFEQIFFENLLRVTSYEITKEGNLLLFDKKPNTNETMIFRKQDNN